MSIFDTLRYPISDPPAREELEALPPVILHEYKLREGFDINHNPLSMSTWFKRSRPNSSYYGRHLRSLKETIRTYEE